jgi:hypothetical protein
VERITNKRCDIYCVYQFYTSLNTVHSLAQFVRVHHPQVRKHT